MRISALSRILAIIVISLLSVFQIRAQRTMLGQKIVSVSAGYNFSGFGANAAFGGCTMYGHWLTELSGDLYKHPLSNGNLLEYGQVILSGNYMAAIIRTRSRNLNIYGGGGVFLGYEAVDPFHHLPKLIETGLEEGYFLYGILAGLDYEVFITRKIAIILSGRFPLNFSSRLDRLHYQATIGLRIML